MKLRFMAMLSICITFTISCTNAVKQQEVIKIDKNIRSYYSAISEDAFLLFNSQFYIRYVLNARKFSNITFTFTIRQIDSLAVISTKAICSRKHNVGIPDSCILSSSICVPLDSIMLLKKSIIKILEDSSSFKPLGHYTTGSQVAYNDGQRIKSFSAGVIGVDNMHKVDSLFLTSTFFTRLKTNLYPSADYLYDEIRQRPD